MKSFFLFRVYQYNKRLFFFFIFFAGITVICNLSGFEITPFYVWGMYSQKEEVQSEYPVYKITADDKLVDYSTGYFPATRYFLISPLSYYESMKAMKDPTAIFLQKKLKENYVWFQPYADRVLNSEKEVKEFPSWYKRYIEQATGESSKDLKVELLFVSYENDNSFKINSAHTIIDE